MKDYNTYREEIKKDINIENLELKKIKLEMGIKNTNNPIVYFTILISLVALGVSFLNSDNMNVDNWILLIILIVSTLALLYINSDSDSKNKELKWKSEVIKIRIEELKQEEINRKREFELNKILNQENKTSISKIIKFFGIK